MRPMANSSARATRGDPGALRRFRRAVEATCVRQRTAIVLARAQRGGEVSFLWEAFTWRVRGAWRSQ